MTTVDSFIPMVYSRYPHGGERAYRALCETLAGRPDGVKWLAFDDSDWQLLKRMAEIEGVAPLAYWTFKENGWPAGMPEAVRSELAQAYYRTAAFNQVLFGELERILQALAAVQVPVVVLKGAALATQLYPDPSVRPMRDLDLLVPQYGLDQAAKILRQLDYNEVPVQSEVLNRKIGTQINFQSRSIKGLEVELHWSLIASGADWRGPNIEWFWERAEYLPQGRNNLSQKDLSSFLTLTPTAHLLYLLAHLMLQHTGNQSQLIWFYDIHLIVSQWGERLDWLELYEGGIQFHWTSAFLPVFQKTQACFGTPLPPAIFNGLLIDRDIRAERLIHSLSISQHLKKGDQWSRWAALNWKARLWYIKAMVIPNSAFMRERYYPKLGFLWPLAYPLRWVELLSYGLSAIYGKVRRSSKVNR